MLGAAKLKVKELFSGEEHLVGNDDDGNAPLSPLGTVVVAVLNVNKPFAVTLQAVTVSPKNLKANGNVILPLHLLAEIPAAIEVSFVHEAVVLSVSFSCVVPVSGLPPDFILIV